MKFKPPGPSILPQLNEPSGCNCHFRPDQTTVVRRFFHAQHEIGQNRSINRPQEKRGREKGAVLAFS